MANKKKDVYRPKPMTEGKKAVIQGLLDEYDIQSAEERYRSASLRFFPCFISFSYLQKPLNAVFTTTGSIKHEIRSFIYTNKSLQTTLPES